KKLDHELGNLLWRQAHDRFARSLDRYWQIIGQEHDGTVTREEHNGLVHAGNILTDNLAIVRQVCATARQRFGVHDLDVLAGADDDHRTLSRVATDLVATAQDAAMFKRRQADIASVGMRAEKVLESVGDAQELLKI